MHIARKPQPSVLLEAIAIKDRAGPPPFLLGRLAASLAANAAGGYVVSLQLMLIEGVSGAPHADPAVEDMRVEHRRLEAAVAQELSKTMKR